MKKKKFSSFKENQMLFESWRGYAHSESPLVTKEIEEILSSLHEGMLEEGALQAIGNISKKLGVNKLLLIAAATGMLAPSTANAGVLDKFNSIANNVRDQITQVADQAKSQLTPEDSEALEQIGQEKDNAKGVKASPRSLSDQVKTFYEEFLGKVKTIKEIEKSKDISVYEITLSTGDVKIVAASPVDMGMYDLDADSALDDATRNASGILLKIAGKVSDAENFEYEGPGARQQGFMFLDKDGKQVSRAVASEDKGHSGYVLVTMP